MNADGTDPVNITNTPEVDGEDPTWQPLPTPSNPTIKAECKKGGYREFGFKNQGKCIAFVCTGGNFAPDICVMNANGSGVTNVTNTPDR